MESFEFLIIKWSNYQNHSQAVWLHPILLARSGLPLIFCWLNMLMFQASSPSLAVAFWPLTTQQTCCGSCLPGGPAGIQALPSLQPRVTSHPPAASPQLGKTPNSGSGGLDPSQGFSQCLENFIPLPDIHSPLSPLVMLLCSHARSFPADITVTQAVMHWKISFSSSTNI